MTQKGALLAAAAAALLFSLLPAPDAAAQRREARRVRDAAAVLAEMTAVPERQVPAALMKDVRAIAVFPRVQKAGFVIGGQRGEGVLVMRGKDGSWGSPLFLTLAGGSVGMQFGVQSIDLVLFFRTEDSVRAVFREGFTIGVDAAVAAGSAGRQAGAITDTAMTAEVLSYARSRGIFAGVSVSGSTIQPDDDANAAYYGGEDVRVRDFLSGGLKSAAPSAAELRQALEELARTAVR
jgi:lipid-binding SYLF domain-containing protein